MSGGDPSEKKYWAFISYSSKDKSWGEWLHRRLENYPIPREFRGMEVFDGAVLGRNLRPIFRDRDELSGSADLGPAILKGLKSSRFLVVLCSPDSAKSKWVNQEIEDFRSLGREGYILALILSGHPNALEDPAVSDDEECFPPALRLPHEPLAGDLRKDGDGKERGFLKILAGIAQLDFDVLYRRHERLARKRRLLLGVTAVLAMAVLGFLTITAVRERNRADSNLERANQLLTEASFTAWRNAQVMEEELHHQASLAFLAQGLRSDPANTGLATFATSIIRNRTYPLRTLNFQWPVAAAAFCGGAGEIIVAEELFPSKIRYSHWNYERLLQLDEVVLPRDKSLDARLIEERPWLKPWEGTLPWEGSDGGPLQPVMSPSALAIIMEGGDPCVLTKHRLTGLPWSHFLTDEPEALLRLPVAERSVSIDINKDGTRALTAHTPDPANQAQHDGRVLVWEFRRQPWPGLLIPPTLSREEPVREEESAVYEFRRQEGENSFEVVLRGDEEVLWKYAGEAKSRAVPFFDEEKGRACVVIVRDSKPGTFIFQWRELQTGRVLVEGQGQPIRPVHDAYLHQVAFHPKEAAIAFCMAGSLFSWSADTNTFQEATLDGVELTGRSALKIDPSGSCLYLAGGKLLLCLSWADLNVLGEPRYHGSAISEIKLESRGQALATSSGSPGMYSPPGYVQFWQLPGLLPLGNRLWQEQPVVDFHLIGNDEILLTLTDEGNDPSAANYLQLWEPRAQLPLTIPLGPPRHAADYGESELEFESFVEGQPGSLFTIETLEDSRQVRAERKLLTTTRPCPRWFSEAFLPFVAARDVSERAGLIGLGPEILAEHHDTVRQVLKTTSLEDWSEYHQVAEWYFTDHSLRSSDPLGERPLTDVLEEEFFGPARVSRDRGHRGDLLGRASALDLSHPLLDFHRAALLDEPKEDSRQLVARGLYLLSLDRTRQRFGPKRWEGFLDTAEGLIREIDYADGLEVLQGIRREFE